jgi:hypothetical protein
LDIGLTGSHTLSSIARSGSAFLKISPQEKLRMVNLILSERTEDLEVVSLIDELCIEFILIRKTKEVSLARLERLGELIKIYEDSSFVIFVIFKFAKVD